MEGVAPDTVSATAWKAGSRSARGEVELRPPTAGLVGWLACCAAASSAWIVSRWSEIQKKISEFQNFREGLIYHYHFGLYKFEGN
jgi:hypothetical protein